MISIKHQTIIGTISAALLTLACSESEDCQRARMQTSKSWAAAQRIAKTQMAPGRDVSTWQKIEEQADLLQSAFATRQITWDSASKKQGEINQLFGQYEQNAAKDSTLTGFRALLDRVNKEQAETAKVCK